MGLMSRLLHREAPPDAPCPRCGIPAPPGATECAACGWDLRDAYHAAFTGSHIQEEPTEADDR